MKLFKTLGPVLFSAFMNIMFYIHLADWGMEEDTFFWILGMVILGGSFIGLCYHGYKTYTGTWRR